MYSWPERQKWAAALAVSSFTFISPISSSMVAPAVTQIGVELNITNPTELSMLVSVFVLAYGEARLSLCSLHPTLKHDKAVGPLFLGPLSEIYGRSRVLQLANLFFLGLYHPDSSRASF